MNPADSRAVALPPGAYDAAVGQKHALMHIGRGKAGIRALVSLGRRDCSGLGDGAENQGCVWT